ncbi:hypothetical protein M5K25_022791 [Dendrobium thyrsiflorum]|uniref:Secreted protein n=1 Tax=Dendrobium thyrsiflorum TaxID=117978 RepID=A0ABD0UD53_DENTH
MLLPRPFLLCCFASRAVSPHGHFFIASSPRSTTSVRKSRRELARCEGNHLSPRPPRQKHSARKS